MAKLKRKKHSPAGKVYKLLGDEWTQEHYREKQQTLRRQRRIDALGKTETTAQKDQNTYVPTTSGSPLSFVDWSKKEGRSATQSSLRAYRGYKRSYGK